MDPSRLAAQPVHLPRPRPEKTDAIHIRNGNVIVGEVKIMELGLLEYSVDHIVGGLRIKWEHVLRLTSDQPLDIELGNGQFYFGSFVESSADGELRIQTAAGEFDVKMADVVLIEPIKSSFWKRFDGNLSTELSFAKASDLCSSASVALRHIAL